MFSKVFESQSHGGNLRIVSEPDPQKNQKEGLGEVYRVPGMHTFTAYLPDPPSNF